MKKVKFQSKNGQNITLSAVINFPDEFDESKTYPAVIVTHPGGGVKDQTAGLHARMLAEEEFVTIAFDASYQGESTGEPRQLEDPVIRTEDVSSVVDYLTTLPYVDDDRIGGVGICAGGAYTANAAINDHRIKAVGTVSAVNIGSMFCNGWNNNIKSADAIPVLESGSRARTAEAGGAAAVTIPSRWRLFERKMLRTRNSRKPGSITTLRAANIPPLLVSRRPEASIRSSRMTHSTWRRYFLLSLCRSWPGAGREANGWATILQARCTFE
jgi:fermentation-respiration switch protein FrsA (DUF1100 family)